MAQKLDPRERLEALASLPGWQEVEGRDAICRQFRFRNFNQAFGFMTQVALLAEKMDHHPEWTLKSNSLTIGLSTHEIGG